MFISSTSSVSDSSISIMVTLLIFRGGGAYWGGALIGEGRLLERGAYFENLTLCSRAL